MTTPFKSLPLSIFSILAWFLVGLTTPIVILISAIPRAYVSEHPHLAALLFSIGWTCVMTVVCATLNGCLVRRSRWSFCKLMYGNLLFSFVAFTFMLGGFR